MLGEETPSSTHEEEEDEEEMMSGNEMEEMVTIVGVGRWQIPLILSACLGTYDKHEPSDTNKHTQ